MEVFKMAFQVDMSPLTRSSMNIGSALSDIGQKIGQGIQQRQLKADQEQEQGDIEALMRQAMSGDPIALEELMIKSPQAAQQVAQYLQQQMAGEQAEIDKTDSARLEANKKTIQKLYQIQNLPEAQRAEAYQAVIADPLDDFDETDLPYMDDTRNLQAKAVEFFGADDAKAMFGIGEDEGFTLGKGEVRYDSKGNKIAGTATKQEQVKIPDVLLEGLSDDLKFKASAAYRAAGGGKDGMTAYQRQVDKGTEQEKRLASPSILKANFPNASTAEMNQLQGAMDAAKTTENGLKEAAKVRTEQKRLVKAKGFQDRAVELLTSILDNPELGDVLGSIEGAIDFRLQDSESELIADIEEAGNILTADNLSLMSGVLSESDIKILKNLAGGGLIRTRSEKRFKSDVQKLKDKLSSKKAIPVGSEANTANKDKLSSKKAIPVGSEANTANKDKQALQ